MTDVARERYGLRPGAVSPTVEPRPVAGEPSWAVPIDMILYQASTTSLIFLLRARDMGATFAKQAVVWRVGDRLVARVDFLVPVGPEKWCEQIVQLTTPLWEARP